MDSSVVIPALFTAISQFCDVPAPVLYAVATVESNGHYWTSNIDTHGTFYETREELYNAVNDAISDGRSVDIGLMQLNWKWKQAYTHSVWQLTEPTYNLIVACRILNEHYQQHSDWIIAAGYYHREAGRQKDFRARERYTRKVKAALLRINDGH